MTEPAAEVRVRLVVDDASQETLEKVKDGLHGTGEEAKVTQELLKGIGLNIEKIAMSQQASSNKTESMSKEVFKGNLAFEAMKQSVDLVGTGVREAWELTEKLADASLEAAEAAEDQEKKMAGFLFLMDGGKHSMEDMRTYTAGLREDFEGFAITAGVATKDLVATYDKLIERGQMGSEKAREMTQEMAMVGKIIPGGSEALAQGFSAMEAGMVRARNPLVQLIAATHMLQGNAKAVAAQMQHMTPEKQMQLAEKAIDRQAEALKKMGGVVPDLGQLKVSFEDVKDSFLESMGRPMMEQLVPQLVRLRDFLVVHGEAINAFAEKVGYKLADTLSFVANAIEGIYDGLTYNWDEFKNTFNGIFADWETMWAGGKESTADIKQEFFAVGTTLKDIFLDISKIIEGTLSFAMGAADAVTGHMPGTTRAKMSGETMTAMTQKPTTTAESLEKAINEYTAKAAGKVDPAEVAKQVAQARQYFAQEQKEVQRIGQESSSKDWNMINEELQAAKNQGDQEMVGYILRTVAATKEGAEAIEHHNVAIDSSFGDLKRIFDENIPEIAKAMRQNADKIKQEGGIKAPKPTMVFTGPIHIKQDFKDQDPDRILLTFRKDLAQSAANRTTSRNASLFGL